MIGSLLVLKMEEHQVKQVISAQLFTSYTKENINNNLITNPMASNNQKISSTKCTHASNFSASMAANCLKQVNGAINRPHTK